MGEEAQGHEKGKKLFLPLRDKKQVKTQINIGNERAASTLPNSKGKI
jgi:hypothetical protein